MIQITLRIFTWLICLTLTIELIAADPDAPLIKAYKFEQGPTIDGVMDNMWEALPWNSLNYVWMDWDALVDSADYFGQFKIAWSADSNLLYLFVEITDDMLVERYSEMQQTNHYNDIVEVFLDEDASGGEHIFDGSTNAENAFSYHITPLEYPEEGSPATSFVVGDLDGTNWGDSQSRNYVDHFPEIVLLKDGDRYIWEFSLIVYTDDYEAEAPEGTRSDLQIGKEMGIALAYCETDLTGEYMREMFLGSFPGHDDKLGSADDGNNYGYNDTWQNADDYHVLSLEDALAPESIDPLSPDIPDNIRIFSDERSDRIRIEFDSETNGEVFVELFDISGRLLQKAEYTKTSHRFSSYLEQTGIKGTYIARITHDGYSRSKLFFMQ